MATGAGQFGTQSSGALAANAAIKAAPGFLHSAMIYGDGTNLAKAIVYDDIDSAHGTVLAVLECKTEGYAPFTPAQPVRAKAGMYVAISGTSAGFIAHYE